MTITPEQREMRRQWVGASDVAAICGLDPWKSAYDVYLEKVYGTEDSPSEASDIGDWLEGPLIEWAEQELGAEIHTDEVERHKYLPLVAHLDGLILPPRGPIVVEVKTAGITNAMFRAADEGWTPDSPPERVTVQTHAQMMCAGDDCRKAYVPALIAGVGRVMYTIERNDEWCDGIESIVEKFWDCVRSQTPPEDSPTLELCRRIRRVADKTIRIEHEIVSEFERTSNARLAAQKIEDATKARLLARMGDAEAAVFNRDGESMIVTNYADKRGARRLRVEKNGDM